MQTLEAKPSPESFSILDDNGAVDSRGRVNENGMWFSFALIGVGISFFVPGHFEVSSTGTDIRAESYKKILLVFGGTLFILYGLLDIWLAKGVGSQFAWGGNSKATRRPKKIDSMVVFVFNAVIIALVGWSTIYIYGELEASGASIRFRPYDPIGPTSSKYVLQGTLSSGMKYVISTIKSRPRGVFSAALKVDVGSAVETLKERGIAHFVEHMAFDASRKSQRRYGIWLALDEKGVKANAFTTHRTTVYEMSDAKSAGKFNNGEEETKAGTVEGEMQIMVDQFLEGKHIGSHIDIEKGAVIGENRMRNNTLAWVEHETMCAFFGPKSLACARAPQGTDETVAAFTVKDIELFRSKWYKADRSTLYIAGDYDPSAMEKTVKKVWDIASMKTKNKASNLPNMAVNALTGVYGEGEKRRGKDVKPLRSIEISGNHKGMDGILIHFLLSDPVNGNYMDSGPMSRLEKLHSIHADIFRYVFCHMVYESVMKMTNEDDEAMSDLDFDASIDTNYQYGAKVHEMKLKVGMGFGGAGAAQNINFPESRDGSWRTLLFTALVEMRRLAVHGPNPTLLSNAIGAYLDKMEKDASEAGEKSSSEIVEELYGDLSPKHVYYHQTESFAHQKSMLSAGMELHASRFVQAEASLLWKGWINTFLLNVTNAFEKEWLLGIQTSPRSLLRISFSKDGGSDSEYAISKDSVLLLSRQALDSVLNLPEAPKTHARSDRLFGVKAGEDSFRSRSKRRYVRDNEALASNERLKLTDDFAHAIKGSKEKGGGSDMLPANREGQLLDYNRLHDELGQALLALKKKNPAQVAKFQEFGALPVEQEPNSGIKMFTLLNGIGVNFKRFSSGKSRTPTGSNGTVIMEIVSLGGRSAESPEAKGSCDVASMDVEELVAVEYSTTGDLKVDKEFFPSKIAARAALFRSGDNLNPADRVGRPGPPSGPKIYCDQEFLRIKATISSECISNGVDTAPYPCDTDERPRDQLMGLLGDMRLKMAPMFSTHSIRLAYSTFLRHKMAVRRSNSPRDIMRANAISSILQKQFPSDPRVRPLEATDIVSLNPEIVSRWVREQFNPDRIEINVVGDIQEKDLLMSLQPIFGTLPLQKAKNKVGYDVYSNSDVKHFSRTWPTEEIKLGCHLFADNVNRAFPLLLVPAQDGISFRGGEMRAVVTNMLEKQLWKNLRMDEGLTYFVNKASFHSVLFPGFGYRAVDWGSGKYRQRDASTDPLNVLFSIGKAKEAMGKDRVLPKEMFERVMKTVLGYYNTNLQNADSWLGILRGMALRLPNSFKLNGLSEPTLKDIDEGAVLEGLKSVTYAKYKEWMGAHVPDKTAEGSTFLIETVGLASDAQYAETKGSDCDKL